MFQQKISKMQKIYKSNLNNKLINNKTNNKKIYNHQTQLKI